MEELVRLVTDKAGISEDKARTAVEVVLEYLKRELPEPVSKQIEGVANRTGPAGGDLKDPGV
jgi:nucleoid DNA-binding protein